MIDLDSPFDLPGLAVCAWADSDDPGQVWACADGPRWAVGADGAPEASLLLYRRGTGVVEGGMATVTVDLALTEAEREAVVRAAGARRDAGPPREADAVPDETGPARGDRPATGPPHGYPPADVGQGAPSVPSATPASPGRTPPPPPPVCSPPQWAGGAIRVELLDGVAATTDAASMADNRATFVFTLDPGTAPRVAAAWAHGLPDARATADLLVRSVVRGEASSTTSTTSPALRTRTGVSVAMSQAVDAPLQLHADLRLPSGVRTTSTTEITL